MFIIKITLFFYIADAYNKGIICKCNAIIKSQKFYKVNVCMLMVQSKIECAKNIPLLLHTMLYYHFYYIEILYLTIIQMCMNVYEKKKLHKNWRQKKWIWGPYGRNKTTNKQKCVSVCVLMQILLFIQNKRGSQTNIFSI